MVQPPETYWNDVSRYYGEILAGIPVSHDGRVPLTSESVRYAWPAQEEDVQACVLRKTYHMLGIVATTHHQLGLRRTEFDTAMTHWIRFDPARNKIVRVQDDSRSIAGEYTTSDYARTLWERHKMARRIGILAPTAEDYTLLHDELQRGAQFRSYDIRGDA